VKDTHKTSEEPPLRENILSALQAGKIPNRTPDRTWGGSGVGATCAICELPLTRADMGVEIQFDHDGDTGLDKYHFHIRCYAAWEFERRRDGH